jgi:opacity protein-like surface antigen
VSAHAQPPAPSWAGFYMGANAGGEWKRETGFYPVVVLPALGPGPPPSLPPPQNTPYSLFPMSGLLGSQLGYNFQVTQQWLFGLEGDFEWGRGSSTAYTQLYDANGTPAGLSQISAALDWSASLRGRVGYTEGLWLFYTTGGVSFLREKFSVSESASSSITAFDHFATVGTAAGFVDKTFVGWVVGAGVENKLSEKWTIRVQYLFADYGHVDFGTAFSGVSTSTGPGNCNCSTNSTGFGTASGYLTTQTVTISLNLMIP